MKRLSLPLPGPNSAWGWWIYLAVGWMGGICCFHTGPVKSARPRGNAGNALILASGPRGYSLNPPWPELLSGDEKALNRFLRKESDTAATVRFVFVWWGFNSDHSFSSFFFFFCKKFLSMRTFETESMYGLTAPQLAPHLWDCSLFTLGRPSRMGYLLCHDILPRYKWSQEDESLCFLFSATMRVTLCFCVKYLDNFRIDCHDVWSP